MITVVLRPRQRFRPFVRWVGQKTRVGKQDKEGETYQRKRGRGVGVAVERHGNLLGWRANYDVAVWVVQLFGDFAGTTKREGTKVTRTGGGGQFVGRNPAPSSELRSRGRGARGGRRVLDSLYPGVPRMDQR